LKEESLKKKNWKSSTLEEDKEEGGDMKTVAGKEEDEALP
jgi:hypothetical protein